MKDITTIVLSLAGVLIAGYMYLYSYWDGEKIRFRKNLTDKMMMVKRE